MHIVRDLERFTPDWRGAVVTLGVFDGFHRGHRSLLEKIQKRSRKLGLAQVLLTYHPHPDVVLGKRGESASELYVLSERLALLQQFELDAAVILPFSKELARMTALRFLKEILLKKLLARHIVIGYDQCFGRGRKGDYKFLKSMGVRYSYTVERIGAVRWFGRTISTTLIRNLLSEGRVERANRLLGHEFFVTAMVVRGSSRGKELGFPTANLEVPLSKLLPAEGVYAACVDWAGRRFRAMVNIGRAPTFQRRDLTVEAHLLGFEGDLYGRQLRLVFLHRIRDEMQFESVEALKRQLEVDRKRVAGIPLP